MSSLAAPPSCHAPPGTRTAPEARLPPDENPAGVLSVLLVGSPNVGKSALFNRLTGAYVTVSNYPGTTVEVAEGTARVHGRALRVVDTPGLYSLLPTTEEERVARRMVLEGERDVLVHVMDAKNLPRMISLTLELVETGLPVVVALNMMDEAERAGIRVDAGALAERLGAPVVPVVAVSGRGLDALADAIVHAAGAPPPHPPDYGDGVGRAIADVGALLRAPYPVRSGTIAALLIQGDEEIAARVAETEAGEGRAALDQARRAAEAFGVPPVYRVAVERRRAGEAVIRDLHRENGRDRGLADRLGRLLSRPLTGIPILLVVLWLGLYEFVGGFGAGTLVDWLEGPLFEGMINPWLESLFQGIPWPEVRSLYVGEYGLLTLGLRYAVAIILPIVGAFFLFFSVLEDSGYFPRLALLVDRLFKRIGLNGRAVIPIVLGFACDTMATMVTRTLETRRERVLATLLLALAIPCSAQLGVILAILAGSPLALGIWAAVMTGSFLLVGWLGARVLPGRPATFHMEVPPLRLPRPGNVVVKTLTRMHWYFLEVLPLFLLASVLLWVGDLTGLLDMGLAALAPVVQVLGLPAEASRVFLFGFFRRDYGAAGLFDLHDAGLLSLVQLTVAAVTLTLFVPCVAQFLMMLKERGVRTALGMFAFATAFAFAVGFVLNGALRGLGL